MSSIAMICPIFPNTLVCVCLKSPDVQPLKRPVLFIILWRRFQDRDKSKPWVFWHRYRSRKRENGDGRKVFVEGPYLDRKGLMRSLCKKAGVRYFRYHALRHAGASIMDNNNVPTIAIQKILGNEQRTTTERYLHSLGAVEIDAMMTYEKARENHTQDSHPGRFGCKNFGQKII